MASAKAWVKIHIAFSPYLCQDSASVPIHQKSTAPTDDVGRCSTTHFCPGSRFRGSLRSPGRRNGYRARLSPWGSGGIRGCNR
jgi:hypothetical protein